MIEGKKPPAFIQYAADILADANAGLSGSEIVKTTGAYAVEYNVAGLNWSNAPAR